MKKLAILMLILPLSGCQHAVPVTSKFPEAPITLRQQCAELKEATVGMTLTDYTKIVVENYILYHECGRKVKGWNDWYTEQKTVFENATKK